MEGGEEGMGANLRQAVLQCSCKGAKKGQQR